MSDAPHIWVPGYNSLEEFNKREYGDSKNESHPAGIILADGKEVGVTLECPHGTFKHQFHSVKGSGKRRTFCLYHMAPTCGAPECDECPRLAGEIKMGLV